MFKVLRNGLPRYIKCYPNDCLGAYFTHAQSCDVTRVQSANGLPRSQVLHMPRAVMWPVCYALDCPASSPLQASFKKTPPWSHLPAPFKPLRSPLQRSGSSLSDISFDMLSDIFWHSIWSDCPAVESRVPRCHASEHTASTTSDSVCKPWSQVLAPVPLHLFGAAGPCSAQHWFATHALQPPNIQSPAA